MELRLTPKEHYLYYEIAPLENDTESVRITPGFEDGLKSWIPNTRVSPIWEINTPNESFSFELQSDYYLVFCGPCDITKVVSSLVSELETKGGMVAGAWATLGLFNLVLAVNIPSSELLNDLLDASVDRYEYWRIVDGIKKEEATSYVGAAKTEPWMHQLKSFSAKYPPELTPALNEYFCLISSIHTRSSTTFQPLSNWLQQIHAAIDYDAPNKDSLKEIDRTHADFINVNAGLSRMSSQLYSGLPPISHTESHFWSHSLLGIGSAVSAIRYIVEFIHDRMSSMFLSERLASLQHLTLEKQRNINSQAKPLAPCNVLNSTIDLPEDPLSAVESQSLFDQGAYDKNDITPQIVFFSGRDGFRSKGLNLSCPLSSVSACNSSRWSLHTVTHEISHHLVSAMLLEVIPNRHATDASDYSIDDAISLVESSSSGKFANPLEQIRHAYTEAIIGLSVFDRQQSKSHIDLIVNHDFLVDAIVQYRQEVEEVLVHLFDYLWFYNADTEVYIKSIWRSWSVIPDISVRIPEYLIRTLLVVHSDAIVAPNGRDLDSSCRTLAETLRKTAKPGELPYIDDALKELETNWKGRYKPLLIVNMPLIFIGRHYFYSKNLSSDLWSGSTRSNQQQPLKFDNVSSANPLDFLKKFSSNKVPSSGRSTWMYNQLVISALSKNNE